MREPTAQTKILASAPVFYGAWGLGVWSLYQLSLDDSAWPIALGCALAIVAVMRADKEMCAWTAWQDEWDALGGAAPPRRKRVPVLGLLALPPLLLLVSLLFDAEKHGGSQAVIGVLMIVGLPLLVLAAIVKLWRWARARRRMRTARAMPVTVCIRRAIVPVPSLDAAYRALPPYCQQLLGKQP